MKPRARLSADDWIHASLDELLENGAASVRIARIARRLGVTRGSFYWHFRDRKHLQKEMLRHWQERLREAVAAAEVAGAERAKFQALPRILAGRKLPQLDEAVRRWARTDASVASSVARADALRVRLVEGLLRTAGLDAATARRRAPLFLWTHIGSIGADPLQRRSALGELAEILLAPPRRRGDSATRSRRKSLSSIGSQPRD